MEQHYMSLIWKTCLNNNLTDIEQQNKIVEILSEMHLHVYNNAKHEVKEHFMKSVKNELSKI